jgi:subtilase family serine protease
MLSRIHSLMPTGELHMKDLRKLILIALCAAPSSFAVAQSAASATALQQLNGYLTPQILAAPLVGPVPANVRLTLTVGLAIDDMPALIEAADRISDPDSPSYRKYLTPEEFADLYGASLADYQTLLEWGQAHNLTVTAHRNRFVATFVGPVADIETALHVHMNYRQRIDCTSFYAPDAEPSIDLALPVEHIGGLDNFEPATSSGGSGPKGDYWGTDFRHAYAPNITLTGVGQTIGILMMDNFDQTDIDGYATHTKQTFLPVQVVGGNNKLPGLEGTLDVEMALSMAPAAQVVAFLGDHGGEILAEMADRPHIRQLTSSWTWHYGANTDVKLMRELEMQGQSFFQDSADYGAYWVDLWPTYISGSLDCRQFPDITIVGGTRLDMTDDGEDYGVLETAWPKSSGGIESSAGDPIPSYQMSIAGLNGASSTHRNFPDVSAAAQGVSIFFKGQVTGGVNGTSVATPLWAGFTALVNQLTTAAGAPPVGFANPTMYKIATTNAYIRSFHDIVSGCTPNGKSGVEANEYCAGPGYDLTTGLGSPKSGLIYELSGVPSFLFYCQGPLFTNDASPQETPFRWSHVGAGAESPGPGECAWADRGPRGTEIKAGYANVILGDLHQVANLPAGKYAAIGVYNDPKADHDMAVTQIIGLVEPPFSSSPTLP